MIYRMINGLIFIMKMDKVTTVMQNLMYIFRCELRQNNLWKDKIY